MTETRKLDLLRHLRPLHLMTTILMYMLGAGFARYLGERINVSVFFLGFSWMICLQLGFYFLGDYYQTPFEKGLISQKSENKSTQAGKSDRPEELLLYGALSLFAAAAVLVIFLGIRGDLTLSSGIVMTAIFCAFVLIVVPGLSLDTSGVGEFITAILLVVLPPALAFILQFESFHPFLSLGVFPLFPLHLAMILILRLKSYPTDLINDRKTIIIRLGWVRAVFLLNLLILSGFLLFGVTLLFGMPFRLIGLVFLVLPAAGFLVWYLSRLETGAPVRWPLITYLSLVTFFLPAYLITYSVWTR